MQGRSKSRDLLQSVLFVLEFHFEFDNCMERFPCVFKSFCVSGNLPRFRLRRPRFEAFLVDSRPCIKPFGQLRRPAL
jgi:hypothetical protein